MQSLTRQGNFMRPSLHSVDGVPIPFGMVLLVCSYELHLPPPIIFSGLVFAYPHFPFPKCSAHPSTVFR